MDMQEFSVSVTFHHFSTVHNRKNKLDDYNKLFIIILEIIVLLFSDIVQYIENVNLNLKEKVKLMNYVGFRIKTIVYVNGSGIY